MRADSILDYMVKKLDSVEDDSVCPSKKPRMELTVSDVIMLDKVKTEVKKEEPMDEDDIICLDDEKPRNHAKISPEKEMKEEDLYDVSIIAAEDESCLMDVSDCNSPLNLSEEKPEIPPEPVMGDQVEEDNDEDDCMIVFVQEGERRQNAEDKLPIVTPASVRIGAELSERTESTLGSPMASSTPSKSPMPVSPAVETPAPLPDTPVSLTSLLLEKSQLPRNLCNKNQLARRSSGAARDVNGRILPPLPFIGRKRNADGNIRHETPVSRGKIRSTPPASMKNIQPESPGLSSGILPPLPFFEQRPEGNIVSELPVTEDIHMGTPRPSPLQSFDDIPHFEPLPSVEESFETTILSEAVALSSSSSRRKDKAKAIPSRVIKQMQIKEKETSIPRLAMMKVIKEISDKIASDNNTAAYKWQSSAIDVVQEVAEMYLTCFFEDANLLALHARRVTINIQDIRLLGMIRRRTMESDQNILSNIKL